MSEADNRQAIFEIFKAIPDIGKVYDYDRRATTDEEFIKLFLDAPTGRILGWEISRGGLQAEKISNIEEAADHVFIVRGYMSLNDAKATEKLFNAKIEQIRSTFRGNNTLGGKCLDLGSISVPVIEPRSFGGVLCHYCEMRFPVNEILT